MGLAGADELKALLNDLPKRLQRKFIGESLLKAAEPVLQRARANTPVRTGDYRNALKISTVKRSRRGPAVRVGTEAGDFQGDQFYGSFLEFGYKKQPVVRLPDGRFISMKRGRGRPTKVAPLWIIRNAAESARPQVAAIFGRELKTRIENYAIVMARKAAASIARQTAKESRALKALGKLGNH